MTRWLRALERYARSPSPRRDAGERCELCAAALEAEHRHVADLDAQSLLCACRACALLFAAGGEDVAEGAAERAAEAAAGGASAGLSPPARARYRTVPERVVVDPAFRLSEQEWRALQIPVRLAYLFQSSRQGRWVACYPSPAGPAEAEVPEAAWVELRPREPLVRSVVPDVEALLVSRERSGACECLLVPIDACYELVGLVRRHWKGMDGGEVMAAEVQRFFERLRARSQPLGGRRGEPT